MKIIIKFLLVLIIAAAAAGAAALVLALQFNQPPENMPDETFFRVYKGDNAGHIADNLQEQGLIKSSRFFGIYVRAMDTAGRMKTGLYRIYGGATAVEIHNILLKGAEELFSVSIPPGLTSAGIAEILAKNGIVDEEAFLEEVKKQSAEGFLFPDTYNLARDYPADKVVALMKDAFDENASEVYPDYGQLDKEEMMRKVIMASIIEREYRVSDEAARIASVFYNRLDADMYLGSCATVVYVITEELGKEHPEKLLYRDLDLPSEYNTYRNKGLPPGPICNPGKTAINAAFNPEETDYLYFLLEDPEKGRHFFSKSLDEHNKSYELYIKGK